MTVAEIAGALEGKRSGRQFLARCPAHDDSNPSLSIAERNGKVLVKCFAGCEQADVIGQLKARGLWPESGCREHPPEWGTIVRTYDYTDENGTLLYQICRFLPPYEPPPKEWGKCKPRRPDGCGWRWGYGNVRRVLYRLPELLEAPIVFVPEGEKDCESLREHGFVATTIREVLSLGARNSTRFLVVAKSSFCPMTIRQAGNGRCALLKVSCHTH